MFLTACRNKNFKRVHLQQYNTGSYVEDTTNTYDKENEKKKKEKKQNPKQVPSVL